MLTQLLLNLLKEAAKDEDVREFVGDQVARLADHLKDDLLPQIVATFPAFAASVAKTALNLPGEVADIAKESAEHIVKSDPDIPGLSGILDLSELAKKWLKL